MSTASLLLVAAVLLAGQVAAQQSPASTVPPPVRQSLQLKFAGNQTAVWTARADRNYVAEFSRGGRAVRATFMPSGQWVETATEIAAITLPEAVRAAVIGAYHGYQFVQIWRLDRATSPSRLFEISLEKAGEKDVVDFDPTGQLFSKNVALAPPPAVYPVTGTWRGVSTCVLRLQGCIDDVVIYRITPVAADSTGFDIRMSKVIDGNETTAGNLACTLDRRRDTLICIARPGVWEFKAGQDSLVGRLTLPDTLQVRHIAARRQP